MTGKVFYAMWGGDHADLGAPAMVRHALPGCVIVSAMRRPFGFTWIEVAQVTRGVCPSCGLEETLHAGVCDRCRVMGDCGS